MADAEELADRIRALLGGDPTVSERAMFGGMAFLVGGHMAITASGTGGILVRVDPDQHDHLVATTPAAGARMAGRDRRGWLRVAERDVLTTRQLRTWVDRSLAFVRTLPPKPG